MIIGKMSHIRIDTVERYAMGRLPEPRTAAVEEHVLVCENCQQKLSVFDGFVEELRACYPMKTSVAFGAAY